MKNAGKNFYRNLISFVLILLIPTMTIFWFSLDRLTNEYEHRMFSRTSTALELANEQIETNIRQMYSIGYLVSQNEILRSIKDDSTVLERRAASDAVSRFAAVCTWADNVACYPPEQSRIYLPTESIPIDTFCEQQYIFEEHDKQALMEALTSPLSLVAWPVDTIHMPGNKPGNYLCVFTSVMGRPVQSRVRTMFMISEKTLITCFSAVTEYSGSVVLLQDSDGKILYSTGDTDFPDASHFEASDSMTRHSVNGTDYYIDKSSSPLTGWTTLVAVPVSSVQSSYRRQRNAAIWTMAFILLLGTAAVYFISVYHYRPLRRLMDAVLPDTDVSPRDDEFSAIAEAIRRTNSRSDALHSRLLRQAQTARYALCRKLLAGADAGELEKEALESDVLLDAPVMCVLSLYVESQEGETLSLESLDEEVQRFFSDEKQVLVCENGAHSFALLLFTEQEEEPEMMLIPLRDDLENRFGFPVAIGASRYVTSIADLPEALRQSMQALDMRLVQGKHSVSSYLSPTGLASYPSKDLKQLQLTLLQLDEEATLNVITVIMEQVREKHMSAAVTRMICYDIFSTVVRTLGSLQPLERLPISGDILEKIMTLGTVEELTDTLTTLIADTCDSIRTLNENGDANRMSRFTAYIDAHYSDPDLSAKSLADHFHLSVSNLSHSFKTQTGVTVSVWLQNKRFTECCRLLEETDEPIQDICQKTGLLNVSSFIRRFKTLYGVTPGAYRAGTRESRE